MDNTVTLSPATPPSASAATPGQTFDLLFRNQMITITAGFYADDTLGEVFISIGKSGTDIASVARDAGVLLSLALQHGTPIEHQSTPWRATGRRAHVDFGRGCRCHYNEDILRRRRAMSGIVRLGIKRARQADRATGRRSKAIWRTFPHALAAEGAAELGVLEMGMAGRQERRSANGPSRRFGHRPLRNTPRTTIRRHGAAMRRRWRRIRRASATASASPSRAPISVRSISTSAAIRQPERSRQGDGDCRALRVLHRDDAGGTGLRVIGTGTGSRGAAQAEDARLRRGGRKLSQHRALHHHHRHAAAGHAAAVDQHRQRDRCGGGGAGRRQAERFRRRQTRRSADWRSDLDKWIAVNGDRHASADDLKPMTGTCRPS